MVKGQTPKGDKKREHRGASERMESGLLGQVTNFLIEMNNQPADLADYDDLLEYNDNNVIPQKAATNGGENSKKILDYTGVHSTGFKDFLLKSELNRAIKQSGFEHPSEVQQQCIP